MKKHLWTICFSTCLSVFTLYVLLDTFVITRAWQTNITAVDTSFIQSAAPTETEIKENTAETGTNVIPSSVSDGHFHEFGRTDGSAPKPASFRPGPHKSRRNETAEPSENKVTQTQPASIAAAGNSYDDGQIKISLQTYEVADKAVYVADVQLSSIEYLKTAFAHDT